MELDSIKEKILNIRGKQVMLDSDLAKLYEVKTKRLNEQVKRNIERFPSEFMFQLTQEEYNLLRSQFATLENKGQGKHKKYLPFVFTEQGVAMLSAVLNSKVAVEVSIKIMNAFILMRKFISRNSLIFQRMDNIEKKQLIYDQKFDEVFDLLNNQIEKKEGIFFDGQVFEAFVFVCSLVRKARKKIILIDNYIDERVFQILSKNEYSFEIIIYTSKYSQLDLDKYNKQYSRIKIKIIDKVHDRFLLIDDEIYHFGASLKDLGVKLFAFNKMSSYVLNFNYFK
ncbi:MAG: ORF6N domain-containing protein [Nanoarchaeota archaeon]